MTGSNQATYIHNGQEETADDFEVILSKTCLNTVSTHCN